MNRLHPSTIAYKVPKSGAAQLTATGPGGATKTGYAASVVKPSALPFEITYTLSVLAHRRGLTERMSANALLNYVMYTYRPYCVVRVFDTIGDERLYFATADAPSPMDEVIDVADRTIGWTISLAVEAELNLSDELELKNILSKQFNYQIFVP
jgi:hypothetical protein